MGWITWNGRHIFVEEGSSKIKAIGKAIKSYRSRNKNIKNKKLDEDIHKIGLAATNAFANGDAERGYELDDKRADLIYDKNKLNEKQIIKGRTKTDKEVIRDTNKKIADARKNYFGTERENLITKYGDEGYKGLVKADKYANSDRKYKFKDDKNGIGKVKINGYTKTDKMKRADREYSNEINKINRLTRGRIAERAKGISPGNKGKRTDIARQEWNKAYKLEDNATAKRKSAYTYKRKK